MAKRLDKDTSNIEMTLEEAKAFRASLAPKAGKPLSDKDKRSAFKAFWAQNRKKYGCPKKLEDVIWLHLHAIKKDSPDAFEEGLKNFGLKKALSNKVVRR